MRTDHLTTYRGAALNAARSSIVHQTLFKMAALRFVRSVRVIALVNFQYLIFKQVLKSFQAESGLEPRYCVSFTTFPHD